MYTIIYISSKTWIINDPLGQDHGHTNNKHISSYKYFIAWFLKMGKDGRTDGQSLYVEIVITAGAWRSGQDIQKVFLLFI